MKEEDQICKNCEHVGWVKSRFNSHNCALGKNPFHPKDKDGMVRYMTSDMISLPNTCDTFKKREQARKQPTHYATSNTEELGFGDYVTIEQHRWGTENEHYVHKVIKRLSSNAYVPVPVVGLAAHHLHGQMEDVVSCICCGVDETEVFKYRVCDVKKHMPIQDKPSLKERFDVVVEEYLTTFCKKQGFDRSDGYWVGDRQGEMLDIADMFFDFREIKFDVDTEQPAESIIKYYLEMVDNYTEKPFPDPFPNYENWCKLKTEEEK